MSTRRKARALVDKVTVVPVQERLIRRNRVTWQFHCMGCDKPLDWGERVMCPDCKA